MVEVHTVRAPLPDFLNVNTVMGGMLRLRLRPYQAVSRIMTLTDCLTVCLWLSGGGGVRRATDRRRCGCHPRHSALGAAGTAGAARDRTSSSGDNIDNDSSNRCGIDSGSDCSSRRRDCNRCDGCRTDHCCGRSGWCRKVATKSIVFFSVCMHIEQTFTHAILLYLAVAAGAAAAH